MTVIGAFLHASVSALPALSSSSPLASHMLIMPPSTSSAGTPTCVIDAAITRRSAQLNGRIV